MKINFKHTTNAFLILYVIPMLNCGVALTSEKTIKIPPKTQTEVFRLNLIHGNVENLYGLNVGIFNSVNNSMIGAQVGIVNLSDKNTYGWQFAIINMAEKKDYSRFRQALQIYLLELKKIPPVYK